MENELSDFLMVAELHDLLYAHWDRLRLRKLEEVKRQREEAAARDSEQIEGELPIRRKTDGSRMVDSTRNGL